MARTAVIRLYRPGPAPRSAHWAPAAILDGGLTLCGLSTHGLAGRAPAEHELARQLSICADCQKVADRSKSRV